MKILRLFCLSAVLMASSVSAHAGDEKPETDASVQLANIGIPVFTGRTVTNYLFVSIKIHLTARAPEAKFRDMEPYFRDAAVRAASKTSFADPQHSDKLDLPRFTAAMTSAFGQVTG
ncbi:MAG: hypothetical protein ACXU8U_08585, partial [Asticcacaulis sp.]